MIPPARILIGDLDVEYKTAMLHSKRLRITAPVCLVEELTDGNEIIRMSVNNPRYETIEITDEAVSELGREDRTKGRCEIERVIRMYMVTRKRGRERVKRGVRERRLGEYIESWIGKGWTIEGVSESVKAYYMGVYDLYEWQKRKCNA